MRIVIDLQAAQTEHRFHQAGRHALALAQALARQRGSDDEVIIALNGAFPHTIDGLRAAFDGLLPAQNVRVWPGMEGVAQRNGRSHRRAMAADVREAFLAAQAPDVVLLANMFEGFADDAVTSIGSFVMAQPVVVVLHDLRPLRDPALLGAVPGLSDFYLEQLAQLERAALVLALDAGPVQEARALLGVEVTALQRDPGQPQSGHGWDRMAQQALAACAGVMLPAGVPPGHSAAQLLARLVGRARIAMVAAGDAAEAAHWAQTLSRFPDASAPRQLFVDISELVQRDARTGVQRVTRSILRELLRTPPAGYEVCAVYGNARDGMYRYAHAYTATLLGTAARAPDAPIDHQRGDVFLGLDLLPHILPDVMPFLQSLRLDGVRVCMVVYDLLPVLMPQHFPPNTDASHAEWLRCISAFDGALCISRAVARELLDWQSQHLPASLVPRQVGWFHLGSDVDNSVPSSGLPADAAQVLAQLAQRPTLLMVGTVEPRKHHEQTVSAFEQLWRDGTEANLVIVGKEGWMVDALVRRLRRHPEAGRRLFWLEGISDEYLQLVYGAADGLIAASAGEGFGLPLIEAARRQVPVIARDLPVFREVGGEHLHYFSGFAPADLAAALTHWLALLADQAVPSSSALPRLTWAESAHQLMQVTLALPGAAAHLVAPAAPVPRPPRVLLLVPFPIRRPRHGGQLRAAAMARAYKSAGFEVHSVAFYQAEAYEAADLGRFDVAFPADSPYRNYLNTPMPILSDFLMGPFSVSHERILRQVIDQLPGPVDVIQLEQPWLYPLAAALRRQSAQCRGALLVNSTNNIEAPMKRAMLAGQFSDSLIDQMVADMDAIERDLTREAVLSLGVTVDDAAVLREYGALRALHAPNGISPWRADPAHLDKWRKRLPSRPWPIFIASAHPPNFTGFLDAIGDSLACIPKDSKLVVAGGVGPHLERALRKSPLGAFNMSRLQILGVLDDADLAAVKSLAHVFLLPIGAGGGSNIKTAEALYSARPVICTRTALRGFEHFADLPEVTVAETQEAFQQAIKAALQAPAHSAVPSPLRHSLTWEACLAGVPQAVRELLDSGTLQP
ncbi:glycosyltransferase [Massilia sp. S19_KUP03_FR1]|uniref:glycosyltransferase n=1 Tax=Massilia sp. S19_KUP03_FR1 TaxID=3025503 RepID=UPI002FCD9492